MRRFLQAMHETGEAAFKRQLYQSLISQTLYLKTMIQAWRSSNIMISIWWMYNELWPTGACVVAAADIAVTATLSVMSRVLCVIKSTERLTSTVRVCGCVAVCGCEYNVLCGSGLGVYRVWIARAWPGHRRSLEATGAENA
jgi:hypothetical protein